MTKFDIFKLTKSKLMGKQDKNFKYIFGIVLLSFSISAILFDILLNKKLKGSQFTITLLLASVLLLISVVVLAIYLYLYNKDYLNDIFKEKKSFCSGTLREIKVVGKGHCIEIVVTDPKGRHRFYVYGSLKYLYFILETKKPVQFYFLTSSRTVISGFDCLENEPDCIKSARDIANLSKNWTNIDENKKMQYEKSAKYITKKIYSTYYRIHILFVSFLVGLLSTPIGIKYLNMILFLISLIIGEIAIHKATNNKAMALLATISSHPFNSIIQAPLSPWYSDLSMPQKNRQIKYIAAIHNEDVEIYMYIKKDETIRNKIVREIDDKDSNLKKEKTVINIMDFLGESIKDNGDGIGVFVLDII